MTDGLKDKLARTIVATLAKIKSRDPIDIADRLVDNIELILDLETQPDGIAAMPPEVAEAVIDWDQEVKQQQPRPRLDIPRAPVAARVPVPASKPSIIAMPGDPGFDDAKPSDLPKKRVVSAADLQRIPPKRPGSNVQEKQHWDEATLMQAVTANTPEQFMFETIGPDGSTIQLPAIRNIHNQQGMGSILLTYRHPSVSELSDGNVTVDLIAKYPFSLYEKEVDFDDAFNGPKGILVQLQGQYKARAARMDPVASGPPPVLSERALLNNDGSLRSDRGGMNDSVQVGGDYDGETGRLRDPGPSDHWGDIRRRNDSVVPQHTRLLKR